MRRLSLQFVPLSLFVFGMFACGTAGATDRAFPVQMIGKLNLAGGWVLAASPRNCSDSDTTFSTESSPDLVISQSGTQFTAASSAEDQSEYKVKRARRDEYLPDIVIELSLSGAGEGEAWLGHALWFAHSNTFDPNNADEVNKADVLTLVEWIDARQGDGQKKADVIAKPIPSAWTYIRCSR